MAGMRIGLVVIIAVMLPLALSAQTRAPAADARAWEQLAAAEDARAATSAQLDVLVNGARAADTVLRRLSVRALGRLERAELSDTIARALHDDASTVRTQAALALAQANVQ